MNVTPDMLAPIMPKATIHQGDWRPARKKASLPFAPCRVAWCETSNSSMKYATNVANMNSAEYILNCCSECCDFLIDGLTGKFAKLLKFLTILTKKSIAYNKLTR